jgi:hypothetical protein
MVRLHHDLQINPEGIEAVHNLLDRIAAMDRKLCY